MIFIKKILIRMIMLDINLSNEEVSSIKKIMKTSLEENYTFLLRAFLYAKRHNNELSEALSKSIKRLANG